MFLVVGLGNPGSKYAGNRHNVGFGVVDLLGTRWSVEASREKFAGVFARTVRAGRDGVLLKPLTYMNLSGESVQQAMAFFKVALADVVVLHDELDLDLGTVRVKVGGGAAGHNGIKSIIQHCGGPDFVRVRIGVGRPLQGPTERWVLSDFPKDDASIVQGALGRAAEAAECVIAEGTGPAMNRFNQRA